MPSIKFIVETSIGADRAGWIAPPEWIEWRAEFFQKYTLASLRNQTFGDFEIFIQCGNRNRKMLEEYDWAPELSVCFDRGRDRYEEINTDYLAITRIDSDDLFHFEAMEEIQDNVILSKVRECLIFRHYIEWNTRTAWIVKKWQHASPYCTHIFPKAIYKNWELFSRRHFLPHGSLGGRLPATKELGQNNKVCYLQHWQNAGYVKRGKTPPRLSAAKREEIIKSRKNIISDQEEICNILKDFGVSEQAIKEVGK